MEEVYKSLDFLGYPMYEVSSLGNVKSLYTGRLMTPYSKNGYLTISLSNIGKAKKFFVHRLVALAFIPNPDNLPEVNHKDFCRSNNVVENLEWCNSRYNISYSNLNRPVCKYSVDGRLLCTYWSIAEAAKCSGSLVTPNITCSVEYTDYTKIFTITYDPSYVGGYNITLTP